jgi:hypothetical protein
MKDKIVILMLALVTRVSTIVGAGDGAGGGEGPDHGQELPGLTAWVFAPEFFDRNESQGCPDFFERRNRLCLQLDETRHRLAIQIDLCDGARERQMDGT